MCSHGIYGEVLAMRTPDPDRSLGFLLNDVSRLMRRNLNRRVQALGLTQSQWRALAYLSRQEGINQATLADTLEVQPITLARLIDRLEAAGWVERRRHRSEEHTSELQSLMRTSYAVFCLKKQKCNTLHERTSEL